MVDTEFVRFQYLERTLVEESHPEDETQAQAFLHHLCKLAKLTDDESLRRLKESLETKTGRKALLQQDRDGRTPLYIAVIADNIPAIEIILSTVEGLKSRWITRNNRVLGRLNVIETIEGFIALRAIFKEENQVYKDILAILTASMVKPCRMSSHE